MIDTTKKAGKHLVLINVISSGAQVLLIGLVYFFLYRILLKSLGVELLGVWSVVLSTSSLANLANFGVADSVIRFVALYSKDDDRSKMRELIFTASLFLLGLFLLIACVIYPFADLILKHVLPLKYLNEGLLILPYSLLCLIINAVNGVFSSVLDGLQKNYIRSILFSLSSLLLLGATYFLVPHYGLQGVAFAQVAQSLFTLSACMVFVIIHTAYNPLKWNWSKAIFKQIFSYGMKFQFISLANMLNEPVTKILLGKFGGMAFVGYYEMANRLLMQARGVIVNSTQSLVPIMVNLNDDVPAVQTFYKKIFSNVLFFSLASTAFIILGGRLVALLWIGNYQPVFYYTLIILACSLFVNLLITPSYFYYMAKANLNVLIKTHLLLGLANAAISFLLGYMIGGYGVVLGWFAAVIIGSFYIMLHFGKRFSVNVNVLLRRSDIYYALALFVVVLFNVCNFVKAYTLITDIACLVIATAIVCYYFLKFKIADIRNR
ncbi:oligosaccharide flippase family protein [Mucilaginibacter sp.]|uniref:oligosaccharide flippase family protein n=1 Tax=Mucilaginibacter sp. TaxID=1882438 RepID=UPI003266E934